MLAFFYKSQCGSSAPGLGAFAGFLCQLPVNLIFFDRSQCGSSVPDVHQCSPQWQTAGVLAVYIACGTALLSIALLPTWRSFTLTASHVLGALVLSLHLILATRVGAVAQVAMAVAIAAHIVSMLLLISYDSERRRWMQEVLAVEEGRPKRERQLIALLVGQVQSRGRHLVDAT